MPTLVTQKHVEDNEKINPAFILVTKPETGPQSKHYEQNHILVLSHFQKRKKKVKKLGKATQSMTRYYIDPATCAELFNMHKVKMESWKLKCRPDFQQQQKMDMRKHQKKGSPPMALHNDQINLKDPGPDPKSNKEQWDSFMKESKRLNQSDCQRQKKELKKLKYQEKMKEEESNKREIQHWLKLYHKHWNSSDDLKEYHSSSLS
eukprot:jgi/Psemu1/27608/gm1.27608_g